jgi:hypothetical protein
MSSANEFTARFIKTEVFAEAQQAAACDETLLSSIYAALVAHALVTPFMQADESVVPRQLTETSAPEWSRAAAEVYLACGGGSLTAAELFVFIERVAQLRLEPFASVFAAALVQLAERDGWAETVAALSQAPLTAARAAMVDWSAAKASAPFAIKLLSTALSSELEFREPAGAAQIDRTHDRTFVPDE